MGKLEDRIRALPPDLQKEVENMVAFLSEMTERDHDSAIFRQLAQEWKSSTKFCSSPVEIATHPAYQRIIGMGRDAVPLILAELTAEPDHWFWALKAITGEDPVPPESRGNIKAMARAWLRWGRENGFTN